MGEKNRKKESAENGGAKRERGTDWIDRSYMTAREEDCVFLFLPDTIGDDRGGPRRLIVAKASATRAERLLLMTDTCSPENEGETGGGT